MEAASSTRLEALCDREEIRALVTSYFVAQDGRERDRVLALFTDDARLGMHGVPVAEGRDAITQYFGSAAAIDELGIAASEIRSAFHHMGTHSVDLRGDEASGTTYAVAYLALDRGHTHELMVRGLRYLDRFAAFDGEWLIVERRHNLDWMYTKPADFGLPRADRAAFADFMSGEMA